MQCYLPNKHSTYSLLSSRILSTYSFYVFSPELTYSLYVFFLRILSWAHVFSLRILSTYSLLSSRILSTQPSFYVFSPELTYSLYVFFLRILSWAYVFRILSWAHAFSLKLSFCVFSTLFSLKLSTYSLLSSRIPSTYSFHVFSPGLTSCYLSGISSPELTFEAPFIIRSLLFCFDRVMKQFFETPPAGSRHRKDTT